MNLRKIKNQQDGFVAIITAVIITVFISVIVVNLTVIARREEAQTRDRQLNTQALYAAESGVNFAVKKDLTTTAGCSDGGQDASIDDFGAVGATCLLVNDKPLELIFDEVGIDQPTVMYMTNSVDELTFAWQKVDGTPTFPTFPIGSPGGFPAVSTWGSNTGVVEVLIYPIGATIHTTSPDTNRLIDQARTFYLYPGSGSGTVNYSLEDGKVVNGNCSPGNTPRYCKVTINTIPNTGVLGSKGYIIRLRAIYNSSSVQINGRLVGNPVRLEGVQRVVDVTGRSSDVLRRVQIRLPIRASFNLPIYAIETADDLCKLLGVYPAPVGGYPAGYDPDECS